MKELINYSVEGFIVILIIKKLFEMGIDFFFVFMVVFLKCCSFLSIWNF